MNLTFNLSRATIITHTYAKGPGETSVGSKDRVETNGRTDRADYITFHANAVDEMKTVLDVGCKESSHSNIRTQKLTYLNAYELR